MNGTILLRNYDGFPHFVFSGSLSPQRSAVTRGLGQGHKFAC